MNIDIPCVLIFAGKPRSGKSHCIRYFMYTMRKKFHYGLVFTKTNFTNAYEYIPAGYVHPNYNEAKLRNLMSIQAELVKQGIQKQAFVIFDDCLTTQFNTELFTDLVTQHRHYNITVIISTQYIYKINPTIRECANYVIIFHQSTKRSNMALYESFGNHLNSLSDWMAYLMQNTGDYNFIFVNTNSPSNDTNDVYKVYKAPDKIPKFHLKYNTDVV